VGRSTRVTWPGKKKKKKGVKKKKGKKCSREVPLIAVIFVETKEVPRY
jgi:hypothetical protein